MCELNGLKSGSIQAQCLGTGLTTGVCNLTHNFNNTHRVPLRSVWVKRKEKRFTNMIMFHTCDMKDFDVCTSFQEGVSALHVARRYARSEHKKIKKELAGARFFLILSLLHLGVTTNMCPQGCHDMCHFFRVAYHRDHTSSARMASRRA